MMPPESTPAAPITPDPRTMPRVPPRTSTARAAAVAPVPHTPPLPPTQTPTAKEYSDEMTRGITTMKVIQQYRNNLEAMRAHYRLQPDAGRELGHLVLLELCLTDSLKALELALDGKEWFPTPTK